MSRELPAAAIEFLRGPQHAVIGWVGKDGRPFTVATWYDWDEGEILVNMDAARRRLAWLEVGAPVSLTVLDADNWYRHLSLYGVIARVAADLGLADIDRLARRYTGQPFGNRSRPRVGARISIDSWHGWDDAGPWMFEPTP
jgi:hypothetical protein